MRVAPAISLTVEDRKTLTKWSRGRSTPARLVQRAKIILAAAEGLENQEIAQALACTRRTVNTWRRGGWGDRTTLSTARRAATESNRRTKDGRSPPPDSLVCVKSFTTLNGFSAISLVATMSLDKVAWSRHLVLALSDHVCQLERYLSGGHGDV